MRSKIRMVLISLSAVYLIWAMVLFAIQRRILFPREYTHPDPEAGRDLPGLEQLWIQSCEGPVEAWFFPGDGVSEQKPGPAVLFAHGNAELIEHWPEPLSNYRRMGVSLLLPEYRGYGRSAGSPSQSAITEDLVRFYDLLAVRPEVDRERIFFHGRSLGGGAVCALAGQRKPVAMILQSTFTSVVDMSRRFLVPGFLVLDPFDNLGALSRLDLPLLIIHGRHDDLIPYRHAERLHAAAKRSKLITYECAHNDCPPDWEVFWQDTRNFLQENGLLPGP